MNTLLHPHHSPARVSGSMVYPILKVSSSKCETTLILVALRLALFTRFSPASRQLGFPNLDFLSLPSVFIAHPGGFPTGVITFSLFHGADRARVCLMRWPTTNHLSLLAPRVYGACARPDIVRTPAHFGTLSIIKSTQTTHVHRACPGARRCIRGCRVRVMVSPCKRRTGICGLRGARPRAPPGALRAPNFGDDFEARSSVSRRGKTSTITAPILKSNL
jgi:hypothetical protein